jgi:hypothetical protein
VQDGGGGTRGFLIGSTGSFHQRSTVSVRVNWKRSTIRGYRSLPFRGELYKKPTGSRQTSKNEEQEQIAIRIVNNVLFSSICSFCVELIAVS